jgi:hypothetical protein
MKNHLLLVGLLAFSLVAHAGTDLSKSPEGAKAYIISPADGAVVKETFKVVFGLSKMGVAPAGTMKENTGHHHLLINMDHLPDLTKPLGKSEQLKHFGGGQTETMLTLPKGQHTLQLVLGDFAHTPHKKPVVSEKITITVE